jgi:carboxyl-terminal processing protease
MPRRNLIVLVVALSVSLVCYERAGRNRYVATLGEAMNLVAANYINDVEPRVLFEGAMQGMVDQLDPYSAYTSPEDYQQLQQQLEGEFTGVGIIVEQDSENSRLNVVEALIGKPAWLAGIRSGDAIVAIDGTETAKVPLSEAVKLIRGKEGTTVRLTVLPAGREETVDYNLARAAIPLETVLGDARDESGLWVYRLASQPRIGYIRIFDNFGERTADEFRAALATYRQPGAEIDGLVIDLRYNRGGLLDAAVEICDMLLERGTIVTTRGRQGKLLDDYEAEPGVELPDEIPIVVLVDRLSASASEIVAAALQDNGRAVVAGQRSWGKGTVQNVIQLEGGRSALRLTIGSYHRPSGKEIHKWKGAKDSDEWGVRPDAGLEVLLTNAQNDLIIEARRKRDFLPWEELVKCAAGDTARVQTGPAEQPPVPIPVVEGEREGSDGSELPSLNEQAAAAARKAPAAIDPQLGRAIDWLSKRSDGRSSPDDKVE